MIDLCLTHFIDLVRSSRRYSPEEIKKTPILALHSTAYASTILNVYPIAEGGGHKAKDAKRNGTAVITVYAFKRAASGVKTLFRDAEDWTSVAENRSDVPLPLIYHCSPLLLSSPLPCSSTLPHPPSYSFSP